VSGKPKKIDAGQVEKLAGLGCTLQEIGDIVGCSHDTIERRFASELTRGRARRKMALRRAQTHRAIRDRSDSMLIHLGKHELGQKDDGGSSPLSEAFAALIARGQSGDRPGEVSG
jgi:hypothetical protein